MSTFWQPWGLEVKRISWKPGHLLAKPYWLGDLISTVTAVCLLRCSMVVSLREALMDIQPHGYSSVFCAWWWVQKGLAAQVQGAIGPSRKGKKCHPALQFLAKRGQLQPKSRKVKNSVFHCPPQREKLERFIFHGSQGKVPSLPGQGWRSSWPRLKTTLLLPKVLVHMEKAF